MGSFTLIKVMMIIISTLIFLGGAKLLGIGVWVTVDGKSFLNIFGAVSAGAVFHIVNVGYLMIALGALLVILGYLGWCAAQKESKCLLLIFFLAIMTIFIVQIPGAVVALVYSCTDLAENILQPLLAPVLREKYGNNQDVTKTWNVTMKDHQCCGISGYSDFDNSFYKISTHGYPPFCCKSNSTTPCTQAAAQHAGVQGCFWELVFCIKQYAAALGGLAAGVCTLELSAMIVSLYLYCLLERGKASP
ncbi:tetraspanin-1-like [Bombina bombina]|uniref:tetraspanin-1-like n=1 Tax=Bombina bombina TaxID=8345 RepID=UPI00235ACC66|nr:tetraspanin-1-like [Bombina bombina]